MTRADESGSRELEYEKAFEAIEARARRGELTLQQLRQEVQALRRRLCAPPPEPEPDLDLAGGADTS
ncbi:hypothetical protein [Azohydromonas aeria]|uniref:hypothetical protein n=1 Tax=Azohydromonas aeria TaxID=2590212 RepID=UPI0012FA92AB|nr:hypothetical protein [Azohydromonas aeria]